MSADDAVDLAAVVLSALAIGSLLGLLVGQLIRRWRAGRGT